MANLKRVDESDFKTEVLDGEGSVVVLFKGQWCPGCKALTPVIEEIADEAKAVYVDIGETPLLAAKYDVMSIPTTFVFSGGEPKASWVGSVSKDTILGELK